MRRRSTVSATLLALRCYWPSPNRGNDGFTTKTYNHLGNPANGILTAETWSETGWDVGDDFAPTNTQGVVRALKQSKVLRVAVRVELWGIRDGNQLLASSSTVNSGTAPSVQVKPRRSFSGPRRAFCGPGRL